MGRAHLSLRDGEALRILDAVGEDGSVREAVELVGDLLQRVERVAVAEGGGSSQKAAGRAN